MAVKSWLNIPAHSHFSIANIPFGIISTQSSPERRPAIAIGDYVLDLKIFAENEGFNGLPVVRSHSDVFLQPTLNAFASLGRSFHRQVRSYLQDIFSENTTSPDVLKNNTGLQKQALIPQSGIQMHLPMHIGDYTDFYAGYNHAVTVGTMFRGPANALQTNYTHLPVGYHGRASSVVVSGTPIRRPIGQVILDPNEPGKPTLTATRRMDIELELGALIAVGNELGDRIPVSKAEDSIFGLVLMNDWSARDIQQFEYIPLGPFNGKNFGTTISPWVVLLDALEPFKAKGIENQSEILSYLEERDENNVYDIKLQVDITTPSGDMTTISRVSSKNLIWSFPQMIAHHSVGGCNMQTGDLLGSGTISGVDPGTEGSLLEQCQGGKKEIMLAGMEVRKFLKDGDTITITGVCGESGALVGFGTCIGTIESALPIEA